MRDAELRFATLRMRIAERSRTARGEEVAHARRHPPPPGRRQGHDEPGRPGRRRRLRDLDLRRRHRPDLRRAPTSSGPSDRSATGRAVSTIADLPGYSPGLRAGHRPADGDAAGHVRPPGRPTARTCSPRAAARSPARPSSIGREAIMLDCEHPRTIELAADRPGLPPGPDRRSRDRRHPAARSRRSAGRSAATPRSSTSSPDAPLPPSAFDFVFPTGTTMLY